MAVLLKFVRERCSEGRSSIPVLQQSWIELEHLRSAGVRVFLV
jgi:hypothetical protein